VRKKILFNAGNCSAGNDYPCVDDSVHVSGLVQHIDRSISWYSLLANLVSRSLRPLTNALADLPTSTDGFVSKMYLRASELADRKEDTMGTATRSGGSY
jgi:hypothetical protein